MCILPSSFYNKNIQPQNLLSIYCDKKGILPEHVDFPIEPLSHI